MSEENDYVIGIDLGTRNSCVSVWRNKRFEIIPDQFGNRTMPSIVSFYRTTRLVGNNALAMKDANPSNTIYDIKRIIGRKFDDESIDQIKKLISYEIISDDSVYNNILVKLESMGDSSSNSSSISHNSILKKTIYKPEEICSYILREIKNTASKYLGTEIKKAVVTVPAYFNDAQRQATFDAGTIAELDIIKMINEPTAASLAYGLGNKEWSKSSGGNIIIYDLGAGTLDVSMMNISNGTFRTLASTGNTHLGGEDIDYQIMNYCILEYKRRHRLHDINLSKLTLLKLKNNVENAKKILSINEKAVVLIDDFHNGEKLYIELTRQIFEMICNELFLMCIKPLSEVLISANMEKTDVDEVILVGGSTRIPKIQELLLNFFSGTNIKRLTCTLNPDEVVSAGASIYGHIMTHADDPFSMNVVLLDIIPLSLGVEILKKNMSVIVPRNTVIPCRKTKIYSTDSDNQDTVTIKIFEGERKLTKKNFHVGTFELTGFEKGPRGHPIIQITFNIDINGILHITAHEKRSGAETSIEITSTWGAKGRLSKTEIENMIMEAQQCETADLIFTGKIGSQHDIRTMCETILINLKSDDFKLTNADKKKIRRDIKHTVKSINKELDELSVEKLKEISDRLSKTYSPLIAQINKSKDKFSEKIQKTTGAEVMGDDDDYVNDDYQEIKIPNDPSEYEKEEIKALKKTISDLGRNIISIVNNPVSKFTEEDIIIITDYIGTVDIWLYTTASTTTIEFVTKINEINEFTENIMKKYSETPVFSSTDKFNSRDELHLMCLALNGSIKSNYFTLVDADSGKLKNIINETVIWLVTNQLESEETYKKKINDINDICNKIYHSMYTMKQVEELIIEEESDDSDDDIVNIDNVDNVDTEQSIPDNNHISEKIDDLLNSLPDKPSRRKNLKNKREEELLLKVDINKLAGNDFKFKTPEK